jgi:hypothetical protein
MRYYFKNDIFAPMRFIDPYGLDPMYTSQPWVVDWYADGQDPGWYVKDENGDGQADEGATPEWDPLNYGQKDGYLQVDELTECTGTAESGGGGESNDESSGSNDFMFWTINYGDAIVESRGTESGNRVQPAQQPQKASGGNNNHSNGTQGSQSTSGSAGTSTTKSDPQFYGVHVKYLPELFSSSWYSLGAIKQQNLTIKISHIMD